MVSLDDEFNTFEARSKRCKVCDWLREQPADLQQFFQRHAPTNKAKITRFLAEKYGFDADETTVRKHVGERHAVD